MPFARGVHLPRKDYRDGLLTPGSTPPAQGRRSNKGCAEMAGLAQ
jgi:hypothetical protein